MHEHGWRKHKFEITRAIDGVARESISLEVDHIALERNNKDRSSAAPPELTAAAKADGTVVVSIQPCVDA